jgi:hypothetical protein
MYTVVKNRCILASWSSQLDIWFQLAKIRLTSLNFARVAPASLPTLAARSAALTTALRFPREARFDRDALESASPAS